MKATSSTSIGASLSACAGQVRSTGQRYSQRARAMARDVPVARVTEDAGTPHFTPREREVLALLCEGLPNKRICTRLNIANGTVKVHVSSILRVLGVTSRLEAVIAARRLGFVGNAAPSTPAQPPVAITRAQLVAPPA